MDTELPLDEDELDELDDFLRSEAVGEDAMDVSMLDGFLTARGIPVMAHVGLTPQSVHEFGGFRVQARDEDAAIADLEGCMRRLLRARDAKTALAGLPAEQLRAALHLRRTELEGNPT